MISVSITGSQGIILRASNDEVIYEDPDVITTETEEPTEVNETESSETRTTETETSGKGNSEAANSQEKLIIEKSRCTTLCTSGIFITNESLYAQCSLLNASFICKNDRFSSPRNSYHRNVHAQTGAPL